MAAKFDIEKEIRFILQGGRFQQFIIKANQSQLADHGQDVRGQKIKTFNALGQDVYAIATMVFKERKGQPTDMVTAFDKGKLYDSMVVKPKKTFVEVEANKVSLAQFYENVDSDFDILGLNEEDTNKLAELVQVELQKEIDLFVERNLIV